MQATITFTVSTLLLAAVSLTAGCHTIEGAGRDVAATGAGVAAGAEETRDYSAQQQGPGQSDQRTEYRRPQ